MTNQVLLVYSKSPPATTLSDLFYANIGTFPAWWIWNLTHGTRDRYPSYFFYFDFHPGCTLGNQDAPPHLDDIEKMALVQQSIHYRYQPRFAPAGVSRFRRRNGPDSSGYGIACSEPIWRNLPKGIRIWSLAFRNLEIIGG
ncbi:MAG: hypothetical protein U9Q05_03425 [Thermodesulfobacteriota bacterium]|nr:hypothetical protein [Thermodesulfobacteriota bacterium]